MGKTRQRKDLMRLTQQERDIVIKAFDHIINVLPRADPNSFWTIAGYHGLPSPIYCRHGSVRFPTWHRAYMLRLEDALASAPGCEDFAMPFWNETSQETREGGLPPLFTDKSYKFADGSETPNPLLAYKLPEAVYDPGDDGEDADQNSKPEGYVTCRYPYSGLVSKKYEEKTKVHNETINRFPEEQITHVLNENIIT
jgi:tyrosinase